MIRNRNRRCFVSIFVKLLFITTAWASSSLIKTKENQSKINNSFSSCTCNHSYLMNKTQKRNSFQLLTITFPITPNSIMVTQNTIDVVLMYVGICGKSLNVSFSCNSVLLKWLITVVKTVVAKDIFSMSTPTPLSMIALWWLWRRSFKWDAFCTSWVMMAAGVWHNDESAIKD